MKVMCAIISGRVGSGAGQSALQESPVKHLNGNQLPPAVLTRMGYLHKRINGFASFLSAQLLSPGYVVALFPDYGYDVPPSQTLIPPPVTPYDSCLRAWKLYTTATQVYTSNGTFWDYSTGTVISNGVTVETFTGVASLSGNCPTTAGYPATSNPDAGTNTGWGCFAGNMPAGTINCVSVDSTNFSDTYFRQIRYVTYSGGAILPFYSSPYKMYSADYTTTLSGLISLPPIYTGCYNDFFAKSFSSTWATAFGDIYYKDFLVNPGDNIAGVSPATYNGSIQSSGPLGVSAAGLPNIAAKCGWTISDQGSSSGGGGGLCIFRGQSKLDSTFSFPIDIPFWIGECTQMSTTVQWWDSGGNHEGWNNSYYGTHGHFPLVEIKVIRHGVINPGDIISNDQSPTSPFYLPFPTVPPFPVLSVGDAPVVARYFFVVIGQDPAGWAKANNLHYSVTADNTFITADNTQTI